MLKHGTDNKEAYQLYLKALYFWNRFPGTSFKSAFEYASRAIEKDPAYAEAYALFWIPTVGLGFYTYMPPKEAFQKQKRRPRGLCN